MISCLLSFGSSPDLSMACSFSAFSVYLEFSISCRCMLMCEHMRTDREETILVRQQESHARAARLTTSRKSKSSETKDYKPGQMRGDNLAR